MLNSSNDVYKFKPIRDLICSSILAGFFIGVGAIAYVKNIGEWYAPLLFSFGLLAVVTCGTTLFTGMIGESADIPLRYIGTTLLCLVIILIGNLLGASATGYLAGRYFDSNITQMVFDKLSQPYLATFLLAIGCGAMMYFAVSRFTETKNYIMVIFPVVIFIFCGFEHCIANAAFFAFTLSSIGFSVQMLYHTIIVILGNTVGAIGLNLALKNEVSKLLK